MAKGAEHPELKHLFRDNLEETKGQILRLRRVFEHLGKKPAGKHCSGMEGVISEGQDALEEDPGLRQLRLGLIGDGIRTEHYEIARYLACIAMARLWA